MASNLLSVLPATSSQPWRNSCVPVLRGSCSMAHALRPSSQCYTASPLRTKPIFKVPGRSVTARLPVGLHAVKRNRDKSRQENITSISDAPGLQILGSAPPRVAGGRGSAGGQGSTAGRGDGVGGDGGAGRERVRRPDRASAPAQVEDPVPAHIDSRSAVPRLKDLGDLQEEQRAEERAERRRTGDTRAASYCSDKAGAGRVAGPNLRVAAKRSDSGSDQERSDTDRGAPGALSAGSGRPRTAGGRASGRRSGTGGRGDTPSLSGPGSPSGPVGDASRGPTPGSGRRRTAGGKGFSSSSSSSSDGRPAPPGPGGVLSPAGDPRDLRTAPDLPSLAARLERHAETWSREGDVRILTVAFNKLGKLGTQAGRTGPSSHLTATAFSTLEAAYLPLVPNLPDAYSCVVPLMACARLSRWESSLALALVQRLGQVDAGGVRVLRRRADAQSHANLWWALSARGAPREVVDAAAGVLRESAAFLLAMDQREMGPQDCSNVLLACARLRWYKEPNLVHHLTTCLVAMLDANCQSLANALYSLGELAEDCGHQPCSQDLEELAERVVARLEGQSDGRGAEQASFNPQLLSNMLLGCAKLGYGELRLLHPLAAAAGQAAHRSNSQDFANSLYALAKLGCTGAVYAPAVRSLCDGAIALLKREPARFMPQDLSHLLWALEGLRPEGFEMYAAALAEECSGGDPRDLRTAPDLPSLAARLEQHAAAWSREGDVRTLRAAFDILGKMGTPAGTTGPSDHLTATTLRTLEAAYLPLVPNLPDAYSCVMPLMACARLSRWGDGLALALVQRLGEEDEGGVRVLLRRADAQSHANVWWTLSARDVPKELVDAAAGVLRESAACLREMEQQQLVAQNCSIVLLACARLRWYEEPALIHHLTTCLVAMPEASRQALTNALYSLGELAEDCGHQPRPQDLEGLAERVVAQLEGQAGGLETEQASFKPQELSNMILGCAKLDYKEPRLLQPLAAAAGKAAHRSNGHDFANSLYALAKLGCTDTVYTPAVRSLCNGAIALLKGDPRSFKPLDLSILLWALEGLRPQGFERYAASLAAECSGRAFAEFTPQQISNSVWALAKIDSSRAQTTGRAPDQSWYEAAVKAVLRPGAIKGATPQHWSNLLYGLALVRHRPPEGLLRAMAAGGQRGPLEALRADATSQACANLLWALAVLGLGSEQELVDALAGRLGELQLDKEPDGTLFQA